jgi:hypothetical protein
MMKKRPAGVWVIAVFEIFSASFLLLVFYLIWSGSLSLSEQSYFTNLGLIGILGSALIGALNIAGTIALFLMRKISVTFYMAALVINILATVILGVRTNYLQEVGPASLIGGFVIALIIIFYARSLSQKGLLS